MLSTLINNYREVLFTTAMIFSSVFEIVLAYILVNNFFESRFVKHELDFLPFVGVGAGIIFLRQSGSVPESLIYAAECGAVLVLLFCMYRGKVRSKVIGAVAFVLLVAGSKIGSAYIMSILARHMGFEKTAPYLQLIGQAIADGIMIILAVLVSLFAKHSAKAPTSFRLWLALFSVPVFTITTFSVFQYFLEQTPPDESSPVSYYLYLSGAGLIFINILVFILFSRLQKQLNLKSENDILSAQLVQQEQSVNRMETLYNRTRTFRHDIKNHMLLLNMLVEQENYTELKSYLRDMSGAIDESDYVRISGISAVDAILNEKMYEAQESSITTNFDVVNLDKNSVKPLDLCIILSNALDNAIEANRKIEDTSRRYIKLKVHGNAAFSVISVSNPTLDPPKKMSSGGFATWKKDAESHGFGLKSIENTVKKYNGETVAKCEDGVFTLVVRLNGR